MLELSPNTSINELLKTYPFLVDFLAAYNPKFGLLKNKMMRATLGKMATLNQVAGIGGIPVDKLINDINAEIEQRTCADVDFSALGKDKVSIDPGKTAKLKQILLDLHNDAPYEEMKARFDELIADINPTEIVAMEEQLIKEGMPVKNLQRLSELHVGIFKEALDVQDLPDVPNGHPVHTFMEENKLFTNAAADMDLLIQQLQVDGTQEKFRELEESLRKTLYVLSKVEIHYQRKENQLFPFLEKHGITGPPQVMWGVHDEIRAQLKQTREALDSQDIVSFIESGKVVSNAIVDMIFKESHILFAFTLEIFDESDWIDIRKGERDIGYAFKEPAEDLPKEKIATETAKEIDMDKDAGKLELDTGQLTVDQVNLMLKHLPVDITFVDENNRVRYFSAGKERIFPRSPGIIGRSVQNCHPPKSLDVVNKIVAEFKAGTKDQADFWIQMGGKFIYIRYFAVRDDEGTFQGTLEVSQDVTDIKSLEGERRLLNWDTE